MNKQFAIPYENKSLKDILKEKIIYVIFIIQII